METARENPLAAGWNEKVIPHNSLKVRLLAEVLLHYLAHRGSEMANGAACTNEMGLLKHPVLSCLLSFLGVARKHGTPSRDHLAARRHDHGGKRMNERRRFRVSLNRLPQRLNFNGSI